MTDQDAGSWLTDTNPVDGGGFHTKTRELITYWNTHLGPDGVPDRTSFEPISLRPWIGNISIYESVDGGDDFIVRLEGTRISQITGENWSGRRITEIDARYGTTFLNDVKSVLINRQPGISECQVFQRVMKPAERVLLPVASRPGQVDQVFLCLYLKHGA
jgi:hypothetical protein